MIIGALIFISSITSWLIIVIITITIIVILLL